MHVPLQQVEPHAAFSHVGRWPFHCLVTSETAFAIFLPRTNQTFNWSVNHNCHVTNIHLISFQFFFEHLLFYSWETLIYSAEIHLRCLSSHLFSFLSEAFVLLWFFLRSYIKELEKDPRACFFSTGFARNHRSHKTLQLLLILLKSH